MSYVISTSCASLRGVRASVVGVRDGRVEGHLRRRFEDVASTTERADGTVHDESPIEVDEVKEERGEMGHGVIDVVRAAHLANGVHGELRGADVHRSDSVGSNPEAMARD